MIGIICVTFIRMIEIREYIDGQGRSAFAAWFTRLDAAAAARVAMGLERIKMGNLSNARSVRSGVMEYRIHTGPGYGSISGETETPLSSSSAGERSDGNKRTS